MKIHDLKSVFVYQALIAFLLIVSFYPALSQVYVFHDDVLFWATPNHAQTEHPLQNLNFYLGRYLGACILTFLGQLVHSIYDLNKIRMLCVFVIIMCAFFVYRIWAKYFERKLDAALVTVTIFTLPPFEI